MRSFSACSTLLALEITRKIFSCSSSEMLEVIGQPAVAAELAPTSRQEAEEAIDKLDVDAYGLTDGDGDTERCRLLLVVLLTDQPESSLQHQHD